jgi:phosphoribosylanthranilate isomerase
LITQIYGITTPDDAAAVAALGAERIGVVVCEDASLRPDGNSLDEARAIIEAIPIRWPLNRWPRARRGRWHPPVTVAVLTRSLRSAGHQELRWIGLVRIGLGETGLQVTDDAAELA